MSGITRRKVLHVFKELHRTRLNIFQNDQLTLEAARERINNDFKKNKNVSNPDAITELVKFAEEINAELRSSVVQAEEIMPGRYQLNLRPEVSRLDNVPFNDCPSKVGKSGKNNAKCK